MSWTDEKVNKLKELWGKGKTASQIAEIIGGISRNAVIGKAHRLNLSAKIKNRSHTFKKIDETLSYSEKLKEDIESIIDKRLEELTPEHIKIIMKDMIQKHLGWLVVWGGVFGFLIGLLLGILGSLN